MEKRIADELLLSAKEAKKRAYSPYSGFSVGAALLSEEGKVYLGCNIENASFTPTCCAERVAFFSAIAEGVKHFTAIAVVGDTAPCMPCGVCRQVMSEFCSEDFEIICEGEMGEAVTLTLGELLPHSFGLKEKK